MCFIHSAALVAEYLKTRGLYPGGSSLFRNISPNIVPDETVGKDIEGDNNEPIYNVVSNGVKTVFPGYLTNTSTGWKLIF